MTVGMRARLTKMESCLFKFYSVFVNTREYKGEGGLLFNAFKCQSPRNS